MSTAKLVRLADAGRFSRVALREPISNGYVLLAGEVDSRSTLPFVFESRAKRDLISELKLTAAQWKKQGVVQEATLMKASLIPPGRGAYLAKRPDAHVARYDVVLLLEFLSLEEAAQFVRTSWFRSVLARLRRSASASYSMIGENIRRIDSVDHSRAGAFLINYFLAADETQNLSVWDYTAGWFQDETGLDNSILLRPLRQEGAQFTILNHCRWESLSAILPSLIFKKSFRNYVLRHFEANETAAMPILYKLA